VPFPHKRTACSESQLVFHMYFGRTFAARDPLPSLSPSPGAPAMQPRSSMLQQTCMRGCCSGASGRALAVAAPWAHRRQSPHAAAAAAAAAAPSPPLPPPRGRRACLHVTAAARGQRRGKGASTRKGFAKPDVRSQAEPWEADLPPFYRAYYKSGYKPPRFVGPIDLMKNAGTWRRPAPKAGSLSAPRPLSSQACCASPWTRAPLRAARCRPPARPTFRPSAPVQNASPPRPAPRRHRRRRHNRGDRGEPGARRCASPGVPRGRL
jgi:hypothetical protein